MAKAKVVKKTAFELAGEEKVSRSELESKIKKLEDHVNAKLAKLDVFEDKQNLVLKQTGSLRIVLKDLQKALEAAVTKLEITLGFTKEEIAAMGAEEYREKILIPLGMGKH